MKKETEIFSIIVRSAIFAYLKEHYPHYDLKNNNEEKDIITITELLQKLEKYALIPDKKKLVKKYYSEFITLIKQDDFREADILLSLKKNVQGFTQSEKEYILNSVIFVVNKDNKISDAEKELILQISNFLGLDFSYNTIMKKYMKSEFKEEKFPLALILIGVTILLGIGGYFFWKIKHPPKIQTFNTNRYQFDEITFNRYVMYKNKFNIKNNDITNHFKKYAVYYIAGKAQVSFNPKKITYDEITKTLTLNEDFKVELLISQKDEIDKVNAKPISKGEAKTVGTVVGIAGAYGGAKVGHSMTKLLPPNIHWTTTGVGAIIGGATGYFITTNLLKGLKLTNEISLTNKNETLKIGSGLIKVQLQTDKRLNEMYREHFETFIRAKYRTLNKEVNEIKYNILERNEVKK